MPELDDILGDLDDLDVKTDDDDASKEIETLKGELTALKKESYGRLQETKNERSKRQNLQGRLETLTETVNGIIQQRQAGPTDALATVPGVIGVDESENGDLFIQEDKLKNLTAPLEDKINKLQQQLEVTTANLEQRDESQDVINAIVGEDDSYGTAYTKYQSARRWVNDQVIDFQKDNNIQQALTSGQALDHVFDDNLESAFVEKFPTLRLEDVVTAEDSQRHFRNTLRSIAADPTESNLKAKNNDDTFRKVLQKPSTLGANKNAKGAELNVSEKLEGVDPQDIMKMTDKQIEALENALLSEETAEGIKF